MEDCGTQADNAELVFNVSVQETTESLVDRVDARHTCGVLGNHFVAVEPGKAVVSFDVLNIGVSAVAPEKVKVAFLRVVLNDEVFGGLGHVLSG